MSREKGELEKWWDELPNEMLKKEIERLRNICKAIGEIAIDMHKSLTREEIISYVIEALGKDIELIPEEQGGHSMNKH